LVRFGFASSAFTKIHGVPSPVIFGCGSAALLPSAHILFLLLGTGRVPASQQTLFGGLVEIGAGSVAAPIAASS
jgi:hypothetical protein